MVEDKLYENIPDDELFCDSCGMTYKEFLATVVFGCPNCYKVFKNRTVQMIKKQIEADMPKEKNDLKEERMDFIPSYSVKEKIEELEKLLEFCKKFDDKEKIVLIEKELEKLKEHEKER